MGQLRGEIRDDSGSHRHNESMKYRGSHYAECYVVKDGRVVANPRADETISAAGAGKDLAGRDRGSRRDRLSRRVRGDRRSHPPRWFGRRTA